jgi:hypothetical protein
LTISTYRETTNSGRSITTLAFVGSFYTNVTVVGAPAKKITKWLKKEGRRGFVASDSRCSIIFDAQAEKQDGSNGALGRDIATAFRCLTIAVTVHDDSVLYFDVYQGAQHVDHYDSAPGYFTWDGEGDPAEPEGGAAVELVRLFDSGDPEMVEEILRGKYDFDHDRHLALLTQLRLPPLAHGYGYDYLAEGDYPPGADATSFSAI